MNPPSKRQKKNDLSKKVQMVVARLKTEDESWHPEIDASKVKKNMGVLQSKWSTMSRNASIVTSIYVEIMMQVPSRHHFADTCSKCCLDVDDLELTFEEKKLFAQNTTYLLATLLNVPIQFKMIPTKHKIAAGAYGNVYAWGESEVIKVPKNTDLDSLCWELRIASMKLPGVVPIVSVVLGANMVGAVMPRMIDLVKLIQVQNKTRYDIIDKLLILLKTLFECGHVHRDIKTRNILYLEDKDEVYFGDLGTIQSIDSKAFDTLYVTTNCNVAPEQLVGDDNLLLEKYRDLTGVSVPENNDDILKANDIWSMGTVILSLITGIPDIFYDDKNKNTPRQIFEKQYNSMYKTKDKFVTCIPIGAEIQKQYQAKVERMMGFDWQKRLEHFRSILNY